MPLLDYVLVQKYLQNVDPLIWRVILSFFLFVILSLKHHEG